MTESEHKLPSHMTFERKPEWKWSHMLIDGELVGYVTDKGMSRFVEWATAGAEVVSVERG